MKRKTMWCAAVIAVAALVFSAIGDGADARRRRRRGRGGGGPVIVRPEPSPVPSPEPSPTPPVVVVPVQPPPVEEESLIVRGSGVEIRDSFQGGMSQPTVMRSGIDIPATAKRVTDVDVVIEGLTHGRMDDLDIVLEHIPSGRRIILVSDVAQGFSAASLTIGLSDGSDPLPAAGLVSRGQFSPTNFGGDDFPGLQFGSTLSEFNGLDPSGEWQIAISDDTLGGNGTDPRIRAWELNVTVG